MPRFEHDFFEKTELTDVVVDGKRVYDTPLGKMKSVTTVIGEHTDKSWLQGWRDRVGEDEADQVLTQAGIRGTAIHHLAERYVMNDPRWARGAMPVNVETFLKIKRELDRSLGTVYGIEYPLYSELLMTAGRTDLPAQWVIEGSHRNAIVDFKSSRGKKSREDIPHYFIQATAYALMFEERTGEKMPYCVVLVAEDGAREASVFIERCRDWYREVARVFASPDRLRGTGTP